MPTSVPTPVSGTAVAIRPKPLAPPPEPGWTTFTQGTGDKIWYCSNTDGSDTYDGTAKVHETGTNHGPKKTLAAARNLLRPNTGDWLLLKRGDTWDGEDLSNPTISGVSSTRPLLIGAYGDTAQARPKVKPSGTFNGIAFYTDGVKHWAIVDIWFEHSTHSIAAGNAVSCNAQVEDILVEGCYFNYFHTAVVFFYSYCTDVRFRRNVFANSGVNHILVDVGSTGFVLEENVFRTSGLELKPLTFYHSIYIANQGVSGTKILRNIVVDTSTIMDSSAVETRSGGTVEGNLLVNNRKGVRFGGGYDTIPYQQNGVTGSISDNVILEPPASFGGDGIHMENIASLTVNNNIIANNAAGSGEAIGYNGTLENYRIWNVVQSENIVYGWGGSTMSLRGTTGDRVKNFQNYWNDYSNKKTTDLVFELTNDTLPSSDYVSWGNRYESKNTSGPQFYHSGSSYGLSTYNTYEQSPTSVQYQASVAYPAPDSATVERYYQAITGTTGTLDDFMNEVMALRKGNWKLAWTASYINDWMRSKFGK